jgi:hypothetical protein
VSSVSQYAHVLLMHAHVYVFLGTAFEVSCVRIRLVPALGCVGLHVPEAGGPRVVAAHKACCGIRDNTH